MRRDKFSSFAIILSYRKTEFGSYRDEHPLRVSFIEHLVYQHSYTTSYSIRVRKLASACIVVLALPARLARESSG